MSAHCFIDKLPELYHEVIKMDLLVCAIKSAIKKGSFKPEEEVYLLTVLNRKTLLPRFFDETGATVNILGLEEEPEALLEDTNIRIPNFKAIVDEELRKTLDLILELDRPSGLDKSSKRSDIVSFCSDVYHLSQNIISSLESLKGKQEDLINLKKKEPHQCFQSAIGQLSNRVNEVSHSSREMYNKVISDIYKDGQLVNHLKNVELQLTKDLHHTTTQLNDIKEELSQYEKLDSKVFEEMIDQYYNLLKKIKLQDAALTALK